jgi:hypothetical protein
MHANVPWLCGLRFDVEIAPMAPQAVIGWGCTVLRAHIHTVSLDESRAEDGPTPERKKVKWRH